MYFFNKVKRYLLLIFIFLFSWGSNKSFAQQVSLSDRNAFEGASDIWKIVGDVVLHPLKKDSFQSTSGNGLLLGSASSNGNNDLTTKFTHGDIALEFDVLLDHNSSFEVLFQGKYGIRLTDCWRNMDLSFKNCGSIIPSKQHDVLSMGYNTYRNVSHAPGIWQNFRVIFTGPKFTQNGEKLKQAKFVSVEQNGVVIYRNQYLSGPSIGVTSGEDELQSPIVFRINNGHVAIRNINYTIPSEQKVLLKDLNYELYVDEFLDEYFFYSNSDEDSISMPDLSFRESTKSGELDLLNTQMTDDIGNDFTLVFNGKMEIPRSGEYHFELIQNGVGTFHFNGKELLRWDSIHNRGNNKSSVILEKGEYPFSLVNVNFGQPQTGIFIDGPGIIAQPLHHEEDFGVNDNLARPIILKPVGSPLIQRSFIFHDKQKLLSAINVGHPEGIHYTINQDTGSLLQVWKGEFGDVTTMRHGRGLQQVLEPLGALLSLTADQQVMLADHKNLKSTNEMDYGEYRLIGYDINQNTEPLFQYSVDNIAIQDHITLGNNERTITRTLRFTNKIESIRIIWYRIASASSIKKVAENLYNIADKTYYVEVDKHVSPTIIYEEEKYILFVPITVGVSTQELKYSLLW